MKPTHGIHKSVPHSKLKNGCTTLGMKRWKECKKEKEEGTLEGTNEDEEKDIVKPQIAEMLIRWRVFKVGETPEHLYSDRYPMSPGQSYRKVFKEIVDKTTRDEASFICGGRDNDNGLNILLIHPYGDAEILIQTRVVILQRHKITSLPDNAILTPCRLYVNPHGPGSLHEWRTHTPSVALLSCLQVGIERCVNALIEEESLLEYVENVPQDGSWPIASGIQF